MTSFPAAGDRSIDMGVYVTRPDGTKYGVVAEDQLEEHGWGLDPLLAIEKWRESMGVPKDVRLHVKSDEESNRPVRGFRLVADIGTRTTRPEKALRLMGQYLIDLANKTENDDGFYGKGIELLEED